MSGPLGALATLLLLNGIVGGPRTTWTPPVINGSFDVVGCAAQNLGGQPVMVEAELRDDEGVVIDSDQEEVPPGRTVEIANSVLPSGYCRFSFAADSETLRTYIRVRLATGPTQALFPAFEVRSEGVPVGTTTTTPPLRSIGDGEIACVVQNLTERNVDVDVELIGSNGNLIDSTSDMVGPRSLLLALSSQDDDGGAYCRFSNEASPSRVLGYTTLLPITSATAQLIFPARSTGGVGSLTAWTPPVSSRAGDATVCAVQNLDAVARTVDAEIVDSDGTVIDIGTSIIPPGAVRTVAGHTEGGMSMVCRFTFADVADQLRAVVTRFPSGVFRDTDLLLPAESPGGDPLTDVISYSPPLSVGTDALLQCSAVNLTAVDRPVRFEIADGMGQNIAMVDFDVDAGEGQTALADSDQEDAICTFGFDASPYDLRGFATLADDTGRTERVYAAAPAGPTPTVTATASATPNATKTPSPSVTATASHTPTVAPTDSPSPLPSATATSPPGATPTATSPAGACIGDCDGDGTVSIDELITLVNIGLGGPLATCPAGDRNADGEITIDELVVAVSNALEGCPA
jgi:hypothetical protein